MGTLALQQPHQYFVCFRLTDALYRQEALLRCICHRLHREIPGFLHLLHICGTYPVGLEKYRIALLHHYSSQHCHHSMVTIGIRFTQERVFNLIKKILKITIINGIYSPCLSFVPSPGSQNWL